MLLSALLLGNQAVGLGAALLVLRSTGKKTQGEQEMYKELAEERVSSGWLFLTESSEHLLALVLLTVLFNFGKDAWSPGEECSEYIIINQNIMQ